MEYTTETSLIPCCDKADSEVCWSYFYEKYAPLVSRFAARKGIPHADVCDILQETMLELYAALPNFRYDRSKGKFRNFVLIIANRKCIRHFRKNEKTPIAKDPHHFSIEGNSTPFFPSDNDGIPPEQKEIQLEMVQTTLRSLRCQNRISESSMQAYHNYALLGRKAVTVAKELKMTTGQVYRIKNRLNLLIQEEIIKGDHLDMDMLQSINAG